MPVFLIVWSFVRAKRAAAVGRVADWGDTQALSYELRGVGEIVGGLPHSRCDIRASGSRAADAEPEDWAAPARAPSRAT